MEKGGISVFSWHKETQIRKERHKVAYLCTPSLFFPLRHIHTPTPSMFITSCIDVCTHPLSNANCTSSGLMTHRSGRKWVRFSRVSSFILEYKSSIAVSPLVVIVVVSFDVVSLCLLAVLESMGEAGWEQKMDAGRDAKVIRSPDIREVIEWRLLCGWSSSWQLEESARIIIVSS